MKGIVISFLFVHLLLICQGLCELQVQPSTDIFVGENVTFTCTFDNDERGVALFYKLEVYCTLYETDGTCRENYCTRKAHYNTTCASKRKYSITAPASKTWDKATFSCQGRSTYYNGNTVEITVEDIPNVAPRLELSDSESHEGGSIQLKCFLDVAHQTHANLQWTLLCGRKFRWKTNLPADSVPSLNITLSREDDQMECQCQGTIGSQNNLLYNRTSGRKRITVFYITRNPPRITIGRREEDENGVNVTLQCGIATPVNLPVTISWSCDNRTLDSESVYISANETERGEGKDITGAETETQTTVIGRGVLLYVPYPEKQISCRCRVQSNRKSLPYDEWSKNLTIFVYLPVSLKKVRDNKFLFSMTITSIIAISFVMAVGTFCKRRIVKGKETINTEMERCTEYYVQETAVNFEDEYDTINVLQGHYDTLSPHCSWKNYEKIDETQLPTMAQYEEIKPCSY